MLALILFGCADQWFDDARPYGCAEQMQFTGRSLFAEQVPASGRCALAFTDEPEVRRSVGEAFFDMEGGVNIQNPTNVDFEWFEGADLVGPSLSLTASGPGNFSSTDLACDRCSGIVPGSPGLAVQAEHAFLEICGPVETLNVVSGRVRLTLSNEDLESGVLDDLTVAGSALFELAVPSGTEVPERFADRTWTSTGCGQPLPRLRVQPGQEVATTWNGAVEVEGFPLPPEATLRLEPPTPVSLVTINDLLVASPSQAWEPTLHTVEVLDGTDVLGTYTFQVRTIPEPPRTGDHFQLDLSTGRPLTSWPILTPVVDIHFLSADVARLSLFGNCVEVPVHYDNGRFSAATAALPSLGQFVVSGVVYTEGNVRQLRQASVTRVRFSNVTDQLDSIVATPTVELGACVSQPE